MMKGSIIALVIAGCVLVSAQHRGGNTRINVARVEYDCSCKYSCPGYGITAGSCDDGDGWVWGRRPQYCCIPSYLDNDRPDRPDIRDRNDFNNGFYNNDNGFYNNDNDFFNNDNGFYNNNNGLYNNNFYNNNNQFGYPTYPIQRFY